MVTGAEDSGARALKFRKVMDSVDDVTPDFVPGGGVTAFDMRWEGCRGIRRGEESVIGPAAEGDGVIEAALEALHAGGELVTE